jgi:hypothetical protein
LVLILGAPPLSRRSCMVSILAPCLAAIISKVHSSYTTKKVKMRYSSSQTGEHNSDVVKHWLSPAPSVHSVTQGRVSEYKLILFA